MAFLYATWTKQPQICFTTEDNQLIKRNVWIKTLRKCSQILTRLFLIYVLHWSEMFLWFCVKWRNACEIMGSVGLLNLFYKCLYLHWRDSVEDRGQCVSVCVCWFPFLIVHVACDCLFSVLTCHPLVSEVCANYSKHEYVCVWVVSSFSGCLRPDWFGFSVPLCLFPTSCFQTQTHKHTPGSSFIQSLKCKTWRLLSLMQTPKIPHAQEWLILVGTDLTAPHLTWLDQRKVQIKQSCTKWRRSCEQKEEGSISAPVLQKSLPLLKMHTSASGRRRYRQRTIRKT